MRWKRAEKPTGLARAVAGFTHRDYELYDGKEWVGFLKYNSLDQWEAWVIRGDGRGNVRLKARWPDEKLDEAKAALVRFVQRERAESRSRG